MENNIILLDIQKKYNISRYDAEFILKAIEAKPIGKFKMNPGKGRSHLTYSKDIFLDIDLYLKSNIDVAAIKEKARKILDNYEASKNSI